jgi:hypothetical protein
MAFLSGKDRDGKALELPAVSVRPQERVLEEAVAAICATGSDR